jgi:hypothetical protein
MSDIVHKTQEISLPPVLMRGRGRSHKSKAEFDAEAERADLLVRIDILTVKNNELMHIADLDPAEQEDQLVDQEVKILQKIYRENESCSREVAGAFNIELARAEFHLNRLLKHAFLIDFTALSYHAYMLDRRGREFLNDNDLI